jgi:hypothetical protein
MSWNSQNSAWNSQSQGYVFNQNSGHRRLLILPELADKLYKN